MDLQTMQQAYVAEGYDELSAAAKTCQDVILMNIAASSLREHVTIKGGVVMHHISHDRRRATQDIDFDFIRYSLSEESIRQFIAKISNEKLAEMVRYVKENGIELPESIKEQCRKAGYEV